MRTEPKQITRTGCFDLLAAARRSRRRLAAAGDLVAHFALGQMNADGGFRGRSADSDLYYTAFGIECVLAMGKELPAERIAAFLRPFGAGDGLDLVHLVSLGRCRSCLAGDRVPGELRCSIAENIERFRRSDGGYATSAGSPNGSAYGCFLACVAYHDLGLRPPAAADMLDCIGALKTADGAFANERRLDAGTTASTAAAVVLLRNFGGESPAAVEWLLSQCRAEGGFLAHPAAPMPDLLSTATALHALRVAGAPLDEISRPCLDFVEGLWDERGGFCGSPADLTPDCEYTFYGLLAIGSLIGP